MAIPKGREEKRLLDSMLLAVGVEGGESMSRPCVCGGSNENCRYCSGRGEIGDQLAGGCISHSH
jgi:hypothetical protein